MLVNEVDEQQFSSGPIVSGVFLPPIGVGSSLMHHADLILGTTDYYNDPIAYPRWQFLQAIESSPTGLSSNILQDNEVITLIAWSDDVLLDVSLDENDAPPTSSTTLYLLEIPITQQLVSGQ